MTTIKVCFASHLVAKQVKRISPSTLLFEMKLVIVFAALLACAAASHMRAKQMLWQDAQQERENQRALNHAQRYNPSDTRELEHEDVNNQAQGNNVIILTAVIA